MSIGDTLRGIGKRTAQGTVGKQLRRVAGNVASLIGGPNRSNSSDLAGINRTKAATNVLSFPIDINNVDPGTGGNHGHYIMFFINEQTNSTLKFDNIKDELSQLTGQDNLKKHLEKNLGFKGKFDKIFDTKTGKFKDKPTEAQKQIFNQKGGVGDLLFGEGSEKYKKGFGGATLKTGDINLGKYGTRRLGGQQQTISVNRAPTRRLDSCITMFMPATVQVNYRANYTDTSMGALTAGASQIIGEYLNTGQVTGDTVSKASKDVFGAVGIAGLVNLLSNVPSLAGAREALELGMGAIVADRMEMAFKGIEKRKFSYTFKMLPRSEAEANEVKRIIDMFKFHMLPEMLDRNTRGRLMSYPSTFDIKYMYQNAENNYLNKVSECYLESMDVTYGGGDRYSTHEGNAIGAPSVETTIVLNFAEIELITRERAEEGF